jgi:hypothetical protein
MTETAPLTAEAYLSRRNEEVAAIKAHHSQLLQQQREALARRSQQMADLDRIGINVPVVLAATAPAATAAPNAAPPKSDNGAKSPASPAKKTEATPKRSDGTLNGMIETFSRARKAEGFTLNELYQFLPSQGVVVDKPGRDRIVKAMLEMVKGGNLTRTERVRMGDSIYVNKDYLGK